MCKLFHYLLLKINILTYILVKIILLKYVCINECIQLITVYCIIVYDNSI